MHLTFGELGNDWIFSIYGYYCLGGVYLFNGITGLVMNNWDKVEKSRKKASNEDIFFEYVKIACFSIAGLVYMYFLFIHTG
mgnify:CR=1 FL=1